MTPTMWLTLQAIVVLLAPVLWGWFVRRKTGASWRIWMWGALTFFISQMVLRLPLLQALTPILNPIVEGWSTDQIFWFNLAVLTLTASLFEEGGRWLMMHWRKGDIIRWRDGVMFGAGHGGIEAMLLVGLSAISAILLLSNPDATIAQVQAVAPEQLPAVQAQIEQLQALTGFEIALSLWERVLAVLFHTAASLLVLKSVRERKAIWWWAAFWLHTALNAIALIALQYGGIVQSEIALTLFSLLTVAVVWYTYRNRVSYEPASVPEQPGNS